MDKEKCGHCGEYGFQDGYSHPMRICRISGCVDADECSNKLKENIKGKGKDYLMCIFQNKEKGIQARDNEAKVRDFEEKEKLRIAQEKMEAAEALTKKEVEELKARAVKVGLPETATLAEVEAKEKEIPPKKEEPAVPEKKEEGTPNLEDIKDVIKVPRTVYDDKCPHCNELIHEKGVYSDDEGKTMRHGPCKGKINVDVKAPEEKSKEEPAKPEEKKEEKPAEVIPPEVKPEEKQAEVKPEDKKE